MARIDRLTLGKYVGGGVAIAAASFIAIYAASGIAVASMHTRELLGCRIRLADSSDATEKDRIRVAELQESVWVILPKWAVALTIALTAIPVYSSLSITFVLIFLRVRRKILSLPKTPNTP